MDRPSLMFLDKYGKKPKTPSSLPLFTSILINKSKVIRICANVLFSLQKISDDADHATSSIISINFGYLSWSSLRGVAIKPQRQSSVFLTYYGPDRVMFIKNKHTTAKKGMKFSYNFLFNIFLNVAST